MAGGRTRLEWDEERQEEQQGLLKNTHENLNRPKDIETKNSFESFTNHNKRVSSRAKNNKNNASLCHISPQGIVTFLANQSDQFLTAGAATFMFSEFVPDAPQPWDLMIKTSAFALAYLAQDVISNLKYSLFSRRSSLDNHVKREIDEEQANLHKAQLKYFMSAMIGLSVLAGLGLGARFGLPELESMIPDMLQSDNPLTRQFGEIIECVLCCKDTLLPAVLGTGGYLGYRVASFISRIGLDCVSALQNEKLSLTAEQIADPVYKIGQWAVRLFNRDAMTEATSFLLRACHQTSLAANPLLRLGVFYGSELGFAAIDALNVSSIPLQYNFDGPSKSEKIAGYAKAIASKLVYEGVQFGIGYLVVEFGFDLAKSYIGDFSQDTLTNRQVKLAAAEVVSKLMTHIAIWSMPNRWKKGTDEYEREETERLLDKSGITPKNFG